MMILWSTILVSNARGAFHLDANYLGFMIINTPIFSFNADEDSQNDTNMSTANTENILELLVSQDTPPPLTSDSKYFCSECSQSFDAKDEYKAHRQKVHSSFNCNVCGKIFAENKILKRHLKIHNPNKPHSCSVCMMKFAESSNLTKHMKKHTGIVAIGIGAMMAHAIVLHILVFYLQVNCGMWLANQIYVLYAGEPSNGPVHYRNT